MFGGHHHHHGKNSITIYLKLSINVNFLNIQEEEVMVAWEALVANKVMEVWEALVVSKVTVEWEALVVNKVMVVWEALVVNKVLVEALAVNKVMVEATVVKEVVSAHHLGLVLFFEVKWETILLVRLLLYIVMSVKDMYYLQNLQVSFF
jgi:hypothetical protein